MLRDGRVIPQGLDLMRDVIFQAKFSNALQGDQQHDLFIFHPLTYPTEKGGMNWRPGTSSNASAAIFSTPTMFGSVRNPSDKISSRSLICVVWFDHAWHAQVASETAIARGWTNQRHLILDAGFDRATASRVWWTCFQNFHPPQKILASPPPESSKIFFPQNFCKKLFPQLAFGFFWPMISYTPPLAAAFWKISPHLLHVQRSGEDPCSWWSFFPRKCGHLKTTNSWECLGLYMGLYYPVINSPIFFHEKQYTPVINEQVAGPEKWVPFECFVDGISLFRKRLEKSPACEKVSLILER